MVKKKGMKVNLVADVLIIVGAVNWGLVGLFNLDLVQLLFGFMPLLVSVVYSIVGVAGVYKLVNMFMDM